MGTRTLLGRAGEQVAVRHLEALGIEVLARNWRPTGTGLRGEIDIVAREGRALVVCEVKARRGCGTGDALTAVTPRKLAQLRALAAAYLAAGRPGAPEVRIDLIGVTWPPGGGTPAIDHLRGVVA